MTDRIERTNNHIFTSGDFVGRYRTFEKVQRIPAGFFVWNVPEMFPDVVPLAESARPGDPNCYEINPRTLKYLEIEPEKAAKLREAGHAGAGNLKECKKRLNRKDSYIRTRARAALEIFEEIENR